MNNTGQELKLRAKDNSNISLQLTSYEQAQS